MNDNKPAMSAVEAVSAQQTAKKRLSPIGAEECDVAYHCEHLKDIPRCTNLPKM